MADQQLSARARAILEAAERAATGGRAPSTPAGNPAPAPPPMSVAAPVERPALPVTEPGQVLALVDQVVHAAEAARRRLDELSATLDELTRRVDAAGRGGAAAEPSEPAAATAPRTPSGLAAHPRPPRAARPAPTPLPSAPAAGEASARMVAVEMAAGGASRREVDARLRDDFGLRETHTVLDDVYGAGSAPDARLES